MTSDDITDATEHVVVVNDEEQYSVWPADRPLPAGWRSVGEPGTRDAGLAWIRDHWTDLRPRSLREALDG